jgi:hypothetical protein
LTHKLQHRKSKRYQSDKLHIVANRHVVTCVVVYDTLVYTFRCRDAISAKAESAKINTGTVVTEVRYLYDPLCRSATKIVLNAGYV